jgi:type II secretory pathway predicted ATPase ExeA
MYHSFFGMKQRPFGATLQLRNFFAATDQEEALATLRYAITQGRGIGLLTGPSGTGKSLVCHRLTASLESGFTTAMITNTNITTIKALYQGILYDLSLPYHGLDEQELRLTLTDFLLGKYAAGGRTVLIIDEAQNLAAPLLEELRMLGNLEGESEKLLQIVLAGHSRLMEVLRSPQMGTLYQRIGARATLAALGDEETVHYIQHQLQSAGVLPDEILTYDAMTAVYEASGGIPRVVNQLCERALLLAYVAESHRVDAEFVEQASADLELTAGEPAEHDAEHSLSRDESTERTAAVEQLAPRRDDRISICDDEPGTCLPFATVPVREDCLEIVVDDSAIESVTFETTSEIPTVESPVIDPMDEIFASEEIVVDPYAMMDAARSAMGRSPLPAQRAIIRAPEPPAALPVVLPEATRPPCVSVIADAPSAIMFGECQIVDSPSPVKFVESSDNPAVHEVGAGIAAPTSESNEPPILVIESRSQRVAGNLGRVDIPEQVSGTVPRAYRRLFTHARKP